MKHRGPFRFGALGILLAVVVLASPASASHSWGGYHWARTANPFTLSFGDNVAAAWDAYLATTSADWTASAVLDTKIVAGSTKPKVCRAKAGRVEVCSERYGSNGWLGIAQIWVSGSHITQGTVKVNDTYFSTSRYNTAAWRNLVMCQEAGHTLGLDHQDEDFSNPPLGTCMDYTSDPTPNQHPNAHDYAQLEAIYLHLDATTTVGSAAAQGQAASDAASEDWGRPVRSQPDGRPSVYERDLGGGDRQFTFVVWA